MVVNAVSNARYAAGSMLSTVRRRANCKINTTRQFRTPSCIRWLTEDAVTQPDEPTLNEEQKKHQVKSPITGLLAQHAALEKSIKRRISALTGRATRLRREQERQTATESEPTAPRATRSALQPHHDLATFLDYAEEYNLKTTTTVFKGTLYEYTVAEALKAYDMALTRVGKSNDYGIDLLGHWTLPQSPSLRIIVQCKMTKTMPAQIRELEGSYVGAPDGWQGDNVLALLASRHMASPGTQQAIQRSKWPIGFAQIDTDGAVKQFIWNMAATDAGLTGIGVTSKFCAEPGKLESSIVLTWLGEPWPSAQRDQD